jgi:hypothetical protein
MKKTLPSNIIVWLDVDSVLVDFYAYFHDHLRNAYSIDLPKDFIPDDWQYSGVLRGVTFAEAFASLPKSWPRDVKAYSGAAEFTNWLHKMGCYVVLVTHIPEAQKNFRIENLIGNGIFFDEIYFPFGEPKSTVANLVFDRYKSPTEEKLTGLVVDDYFKNVIDMLSVEHIHAGFSLDYSFNKSFQSTLDQTEKYAHTSSKTPQELYLATRQYVTRLASKN